VDIPDNTQMNSCEKFWNIMEMNMSLPLQFTSEEEGETPCKTSDKVVGTGAKRDDTPARAAM
jgi:hypothetical protein